MSNDDILKRFTSSDPIDIFKEFSDLEVPSDDSLKLISVLAEKQNRTGQHPIAIHGRQALQTEEPQG